MVDSQLPERIAGAHKNENSVGYLGHLRELANELVRASKMSEPIAEYLKGMFCNPHHTQVTKKEQNYQAGKVLLKKI